MSGTVQDSVWLLFHTSLRALDLQPDGPTQFADRVRRLTELQLGSARKKIGARRLWAEWPIVLLSSWVQQPQLLRISSMQYGLALSARRNARPTV